ncbi:hypothetical protein [Pseudorhodoplanes sp.]|jgi:hypothetical protein|uniref:hypothetical protein n=1 Tax=Pseudorhodoplanes sp. TaxID=1934341 RepID=UPI002C803F01|nr:hypothetical protein [Pseudorhodoplanes sp.]HWV42001.1 hypothetical protein [Pseudorhodoplanes sp.]
MAEPGKPKSGLAGLIAALTNNLDEATISSYAHSLAHWDAERTGATSAAFQILDTKAAGLLTHVSMMIAGLGIVAPLLAQHRFEEIVIVCEIIVYLLISIGCLRCLSVRSVEALQHPSIQRELIVKHELYRLCNNATIWFTIIVFASFPIMLSFP